MKNRFLLLLFLFVSLHSFSQIITENFNYGSGADSLTSTTAGGANWIKHSGGGALNKQLFYNPSSLSYAGYPLSGVGGSAEIWFTTRSEDLNRPFPAVTSGSVYTSFLLKVDSVAASSTVGDYFIHFCDSLGSVISNFRGRIFIRAGSVANTYQIGLCKGGSGTAAVFTTTDYAYSNTLLIVMKYKIETATSLDDSVFAYVFTSGVPAIEPSTATLVASDNSTISDLARLRSICLRQGSAANFKAIVDGIRVSNSWISGTASALSVSTAAVSAITASSATLGGTVNDSGASTVSQRGIVYGTSLNPTLANTKVLIGSGIGAFSQNITGLSASTLYHVRAFAINSTDTAYGVDSSFTTGVVSLALPSILSFSPSSGPYGTTVIISGTNFNTTAANNIVFFGAAQAVVNSATATSLNVTLPQGATYAAITILNLGSNLSVSSFDYFKPTFSPNKTTETAIDFEPRVNFQSGAGSQPNHVAIGELDGDGMPDIALINAYPDSTVSVFKNNSIKGRVSVTSRQDFVLRSRPAKVLLVDLNGDGKKEVVTLCSNGAFVNILPNTSTIGTLSFGTRIDLATNANPNCFDITDLDGDGKPEIVCTNQLNVNVSVFKNTSIGGTISFAAKQDISAGSSPMGFKMGDIDGDGRPDMAVSNPFANTFSIYRNTSTTGNISFASGQTFTADTFVRELFMADLDGNGKLDMILANSTVSRLVIVPNTSTVGNITFAPRLFFPNGQSVRYLAIGNMDGDSMPDILTYGGYIDSLRIFQNKSTPGNIAFNQTGSIYTNSSANYALDMADIDLDGKPDIVNSENTGKLSILRQRYPIANDTISGAQSICNGSSTTISGSNVINYYNRPFTYKWLKSTTSATTGFAPAGGADTLMNYSTSALTANTWFKRAYYWDYTADSTAATKITVNTIGSNTIGSNQTISSGSTPATLVGNTPTGGTFTYRWISSSSINSGYANASGASTGKDYSPAALTATTYYKRIVLAGVTCVDTSLAVTITVTTSAPTLALLSTISPNTITSSTAVLGGNVSNDGGAAVTERGVVYATSINPTTSNTKVSIGTGVGVYSQTITGLTSATTYHVRAYAINSVGTSYGADSTFTTTSQPTFAPTVSTAKATLIGITNATLGGNVTDSGTASVAERGVVFSLTINPTIANNKVAIGTGLGTYSQNVSGLVPSTTYHVRAYAINSVGTSYGADSTFTTLDVVNTVELPLNNAFTPDGDGINDAWVLENAADLKDHEIVVYNIFGQEVFRSMGYDVPWDGKVDGQLVPMAEYYYLIKGPKVNKRGALLIKRN